MIVVIITSSPQEMEMLSFKQEKNLSKNDFDEIKDSADEASTELFKHPPLVGTFNTHVFP